MDDTFKIVIKQGPVAHTVDGLTIATTVRAFRERVHTITGVDPSRQKITFKGRVLSPGDDGTASLSEVGLSKDGMKAMLIVGSSKDDIEKVAEFKPQSFPVRQRSSNNKRTRTGAEDWPEHYFDEIKVLDGFNTPPASEARRLLLRLATDRGIRAIMQKHRWRVGRLSEMPPVGMVGVDPVCVLGLNKNKGQEILLRLRTDDCKGFRKWDTIYATLLHELSHNVHSNHGPEFHKLNRQLEKESKALDWTRNGGAAVGGGPALLEQNDDFYDPAFDDPSMRPATDVMKATSAVSGRALGGNVLLPVLCDPRELAASAAEMRLTDAEKRMASDCEATRGGAEGVEVAIQAHAGTVSKVTELSEEQEGGPNQTH